MLAVAYHVFGLRVQIWVSRRNAMIAPALIVAGFMVRLAVITGILMALGFLTGLNIIAVCLAFVVLFSMLNIWSIYRLLTKRRSAPPSAGPSGAN